jgi:hypothetical protein
MLFMVSQRGKNKRGKDPDPISYFKGIPLLT